MADDGNKESPSDQHQGESTEPTDNICSEIHIPKKQPSSTPPPKQRSKYEQTRAYAYSYLAAQYLIFGVATVGIIVAVCSLSGLNQSIIAANRQANAAATQAVIAQQEFELSERPWLSVDIIKIGDLVSDKEAMRLKFQAVIKNTGHSPATNVHLEAQMTPIYMNNVFLGPREKQKQFCKDFRHPKSGSDFYTFTLFPNDQKTQEFALSMAADAIGKERFFNNPRHKELAGVFLAPLIVGCIDYEFEFAAGHHQTAFIYMLYSLNPAQPGLRFGVKPNQSIDAKDLSLDPYPFGGSDAD